jgi:hypothetical protein
VLPVLDDTYTVKEGTKRYRYYVCLAAQKRGWDACPTKSIPAGEIERFVMEQIKGIGRDPAVLEGTLRQMRQQTAKSVADLESRQKMLQRELARHNAALRKLVAANGNADAPRLAELNEQIRVAEQKLTDLREHGLKRWSDDFTGYVLDYGAYPDQKRPYFTLRDAKHTLFEVHKRAGQEGVIRAGLEALCTKLLSRQWRRDDGSEMKVGKCLIDANWGNSTDVVKNFCRECGFSGVVMPSHGKFVGASSTPFSEYTAKPGEKIGLHWRVPPLQQGRVVRHLLVDTNYWKTFVHARLAVAKGDPGCLSLFAPDPMAGDHLLLAEHLTAEHPVKTSAKGREVDEWKAKVGRQDNHWLDCLVGCAAAASLLGAVLFGTGQKPKPVKKLKLSEIQKNARIWRAGGGWEPRR